MGQKTPCHWAPCSLRIPTVQPSEHWMEPLALFEPNHLRAAVSLGVETLGQAQNSGVYFSTLDPNWDSRLGLFSKKSFFHTRAWAKVLERTYGFSPRYFTMYEGGSIVSM